MPWQFFYILVYVFSSHNSYCCNYQRHKEQQQENREQPQTESLGNETKDGRNTGTADVGTYLLGTHNRFGIFFAEVAWG